MSRTQTWLPTVSLSLRRTDCASSHSPSLRTERHNPHLNDRPILPPRHTHTPHTPSWQKGPPHTPSALLLPTLRTTPSMSTPIRDPPPVPVGKKGDTSSVLRRLPARSVVPLRSFCGGWLSSGGAKHVRLANARGLRSWSSGAPRSTRYDLIYTA